MSNKTLHATEYLEKLEERWKQIHALHGLCHAPRRGAGHTDRKGNVRNFAKDALGDALVDGGEGRADPPDPECGDDQKEDPPGVFR